MPDDRTICKSCLQPIDRLFHAPYEGAPEDELEFEGWMHCRQPETDHEVVPIAATDAPFIDQVCDFCGEPDISWIFPTDPDKHREFHGIKITDTAWATCDACHSVITTSLTGQDISRRIASRSLPLKSVPEHVRPHLQEVLGEQYQQFLEARSGDPVTLREYIS